MKGRNLALGSIDGAMSALRFCCDLAGEKNHLLTNEELKLKKRTTRGVARAWESDEYEGMRSVAQHLYRYDILDICTMGRYEGMRIHEVTRIDRADAEKAIRTGTLTVVGKNGKARQIPLAPEAKGVLERRMENIDRGQKLFVPQMRKHIKRSKKFRISSTLTERNSRCLIGYLLPTRCI